MKNMTHQKPLSSAGFTLLELVIAITILATLTVFSSSSIQQALRSRLKIQEQIDDMSRVRDALKIMERDIQLAFHYQDIELEFNQAVRKQGSSSSSSGAPTGNNSSGSSASSSGSSSTSSSGVSYDPFSEIKDISKDPSRINPVTDFIGTEEAFDFVTLNSSLIMETQKQAEFVEVGYKISNCTKPGGEGFSVPCLIRRTGPYVDTDVKKGGQETVLLENVTEFKLRYIGKGKQDWVNAWNSKGGSDGGTVGKFPEMVEISLTVEKEENRRKKKISMQIVAAIRNPNNENKASSSSSGGPGTPGYNQYNNSSSGGSTR